MSKKSKQPAAPAPVKASTGPTSPTAMTSLLVGALFFFAYLINGDFSPGNDSKPATFLPVVVLEEGALSFSPEQQPFMFEWTMVVDGKVKNVKVPTMEGKMPNGEKALSEYKNGNLKLVKEKYFVEPSIIPNRYVSIFGLGSGLAALPVFAIAKIFNGTLATNHALLWTAGKVAASLYVAGSAVLLFLIAARFLSTRRALLVAVAYGLGTCVWSISSQALWQHGSNEFFLMLSAFFLLRAQTTPRDLFFCGLSLAAAVACRPTSAVVALAVTVFVVIRDPKNSWRVIVGALPVVLGLMAFNQHYYGTLLHLGQAVRGNELALMRTGTADMWQTPLWLGAAGLLFSPSRGLLIFSPVIVFALWGVIDIWRTKNWLWLRPYTLAVPLLWGIAFKWFDWWGGWTFGYRPIVDTMPLLALFFIPVMERIVTHTWRLRVFSAALAWSIAVQCLGAFAYDLMEWHYFEKKDIDQAENRHRLWSISDSQLLFIATHFSDGRKIRHQHAEMWRQDPNM